VAVGHLVSAEPEGAACGVVLEGETRGDSLLGEDLVEFWEKVG